MKRLEKIINLLLKIIELLPILIELLKALDRDTNVIKSKLQQFDLQIEDVKKVVESKQIKKENDLIETIQQSDYENNL